MTKSTCNHVSKKPHVTLEQYHQYPTGKKQLEILNSAELSKWYKEFLETRKTNTPSP